MKNMLFDEDHRLRNGWWVLVFLAFFVASGVGFRFLIPAFKRLHLGRGLMNAIAPGLLALIATWACTLLRKEPLASVGLHLNRRWAKEFGWGILFGCGVMLLGSALLWSVGGVRWELDPAGSLRGLGLGLLLWLSVAFFEETLFRGFIFQRLLDGLGVWPTQIILALLFGLVHWGNPGMHGATKFWATLDIALAAIFLGLAYLRTRSLALPIGIHLGWNWCQGHLMGFGVSGLKDHPGFLRPVFLGRPEWMSGGTFGLEASCFGVLAVLVGIGLLWAPQWLHGRKAPASL